MLEACTAGLPEQRKTIAVLQVQESNKNKNEIEKEREFGLQVG
jgi:hypothetical protein